jgi:hypothetical protein
LATAHSQDRNARKAEDRFHDLSQLAQRHHNELEDEEAQASLRREQRLRRIERMHLQHSEGMLQLERRQQEDSRQQQEQDRCVRALLPLLLPLLLLLPLPVHTHFGAATVSWLAWCVHRQHFHLHDVDFECDLDIDVRGMQPKRRKRHY